MQRPRQLAVCFLYFLRVGALGNAENLVWIAHGLFRCRSLRGRVETATVRRRTVVEKFDVQAEDRRSNGSLGVENAECHREAHRAVAIQTGLPRRGLMIAELVNVEEKNHETTGR